MIRLAVVAGALVCAYLFLVRPALDKTDEAISNADHTIQRSLRTSGFSGVAKQIEDVSSSVQREVAHALRHSEHQGGSKRLLHCIERAGQDGHRLQRCSHHR